MPTYFLVYFAILFVSSILLVRVLILRRSSPATRLYVKAIQAENRGDFEEAVSTYKDALIEVQKIKFQRNLKERIIAKLKVLHTVNKYKADQGFIREKNSG